MRNDQYGKWASGKMGYGGGVRQGTYETYLKDSGKLGPFESCERPEPVKKDIKDKKDKKVKDLTISELKELLRELNKERED